LRPIILGLLARTRPKRTTAWKEGAGHHARGWRVEHNRPPVYPAVARRCGWEGTVLLELRVLADGRVAEVSVADSSGHEALDEAAVRAVRQWRFEPALCLGRPVAATARLPIRFKLMGP
jgi:TonB family protein